MSLPAELWASLVLFVLFAGMALDGLRRGEAWTRTGRDASRAIRPGAFWSAVIAQGVMAGLSLACSVHFWRAPS